MCVSGEVKTTSYHKKVTKQTIQIRKLCNNNQM